MKNRKLQKNVGEYLRPGDFFVNLGANDGVTNDPIYGFIESFSLKGIAVEPIAAAYDLLRQNYAKFPGVICEKVAIYCGRKEPIYRLRDDVLAADPVLSQVSSKDKGQLLAMMRDFREGKLDPDLYEKIRHDALAVADAEDALLVVDDDMEYVTFEELMARHGVERVDFLDIDIEGYDYEVAMSLDFERWQTKVLVIETRLFSEEQGRLFAQKMSALGYSFLQKYDYFSEVYARHW